jgi:hypothetical protein
MRIRIRPKIRYKNIFEKQETRFIGQFWSIFKLLDLDLYSQYGPGTAKSMRIRIHKTVIKCADLDGVRILKRESYTTYVHQEI